MAPLGLLLMRSSALCVPPAITCSKYTLSHQRTFAHSLLLQRGALVQWTAQEDRTLRELVKQGLPSRAIHDRLPGRTVKAVRHRIHSQSKESATSKALSSRLPWSLEEDQRLMTLRKDGVPLVECIVHFPGRTFGAMSHRWCHHLQPKIREVAAPKAGKSWTPALIAQMIRMRETDRMHYRAIANALGRSPRSVEVAYNRHTESSSRPDIGILGGFTEQENAQLESLIRSGLSYAKIAEKLGRSVPGIQSHILGFPDHFGPRRNRKLSGSKLEEDILSARQKGTPYKSIAEETGMSVNDLWNIVGNAKKAQKSAKSSSSAPIKNVS